MTPIFSLPIRVYYEDTDAGGVVYHSNYLNFMERARTEWLRDMGFEQDEIVRTDGVLFAVSEVRIGFHKPARFNELLQVTVVLARRGAASLSLLQEVRRGPELLASGEVRIACIDARRFVPVPIPDRIVAQMARRYGDPSRRTPVPKSIKETL
jgi:acyl-CoA thioester hydrolase